MVDLDHYFDTLKKWEQKNDGEGFFNEEENVLLKPPYQTTDLEISLIALQCGLEIPADIHLLMIVENAMYDIYNQTTDHWEFWSINGFSYWVNREQNLTVTEYPHLEELWDYVADMKAHIEDSMRMKEQFIVKTWDLCKEFGTKD